jgi:hypothetical protein
MARSIGPEPSSEVSLAAPTRTSFTVTPGVAASAWLTRRTQEPQCIPSILSVIAGILLSLSCLFDDSGSNAIHASGLPYETLPELRHGRKD